MADGQSEDEADKGEHMKTGRLRTWNAFIGRTERFVCPWDAQGDVCRHFLVALVMIAVVFVWDP